jgi:enoyl-CoA hydratase/carnithine racemase
MNEETIINEAAEHLPEFIGGQAPPALVAELARLNRLKAECDARISALIQGFALGQGLELSANIHVDTDTGRYEARLPAAAG